MHRSNQHPAPSSAPPTDHLAFQFNTLDLNVNMPRRKRATESDETWAPQHPATQQASKRLRSNLSRRRSESEAAFSTKRCIAWFREYADESESVLGPEGMEKFCEDLGVEPENVVMLCLAYKLEAQQMGFFTKAEWLKGMTELQCDSLVKLQNKLDYLRSLLNDPVSFKSIYRYAFDFAREKDQRSMDIDTARAMLGLLLGRHWPLFSHFLQFLEHSKYRVINKDQWCNVLEFSRLIHTDLSNYDEDGAWPVLLDEFVEWYKENSAATSQQSSILSTSMQSSSASSLHKSMHM